MLIADQFEEIYTLGKFQHQGKIETTRLSPDSKLLATVGENGAAFLWEVNSRSKKELTGHKGSVNTVAFFPNQNKLATAGDDGIITFLLGMAIALRALPFGRSPELCTLYFLVAIISIQNSRIQNSKLRKLDITRV